LNEKNGHTAMPRWPFVATQTANLIYIPVF
jgi:hypothetical protein